MSIEIDTQLLTLNKWTYRLRPPSDRSAPVLMLLHGWTGDENSMWIFVRKFPPKYWVLAPRAPYPVPERGYTWREIVPGTWGLPSIDDLIPAARAVLQFLEAWGAMQSVDVSKINLMGFSQGAALSYTIATLHPTRVEKLAGLAGFIPKGSDILIGEESFSGKHFYVAHGIQDDLIPIPRGRETVTMLQQGGAKVTFCEADTGHRVSADCFNGLDEYWIAG